MLCPVCKSSNISFPRGPYGGGAFCVDCGAGQDERGVWTALEPPSFDPDLEPVYQFTGQHRFLSNFFIESDQTCVEVEYQRAKCVDPSDAEKFDKPGLAAWTAKRMGKKVRLREDWEEVKEAVMYGLVRRKFEQHGDLWLALKLTGKRELIEGNYWGDRYWGRVALGHGEGQNKLGKILMKVRRELCK